MTWTDSWPVLHSAASLINSIWPTYLQIITTTKRVLLVYIVARYFKENILVTKKSETYISCNLCSKTVHHSLNSMIKSLRVLALVLF